MHVMSLSLHYDCPSCSHLFIKSIVNITTLSPFCVCLFHQPWLSTLHLKTFFRWNYCFLRFEALVIHYLLYQTSFLTTSLKPSEWPFSQLWQSSLLMKLAILLLAFDFLCLISRSSITTLSSTIPWTFMQFHYCGFSSTMFLLHSDCQTLLHCL